MSKHTPGPWTIGGKHSDDIRGGGGKPVAYLTPNIANAKLIAAAPELLAELEHLLLVAGQACPQASPYSSIGSAMARARAAIAKATS